MKKFLLPLLLLLALAPSAFAATAKTPAVSAPDPMTNPVLANIIKGGAKLYYLGSRGGLDGWFIVKNGQVQIVYGAPDGKTAIIGAMFGDGGENISGAQVKNLLSTNPEVSAMLSNAVKEQEAIGKAGNPAPAAAQSAPAYELPSTTMSPGKQLVQDLSSASGVMLGNAGPVLYMVMDPNCPHCQKTWTMLRSFVAKKALQIRMIPIALPGSEDARASAIFLHSADPLTAFDKYVGGDKNQLAGSPDPALLDAVLANHKMTDGWNIHVTPYLVYQGKDGKVKIVLGEPDDAAALVADMAP